MSRWSHLALTSTYGIGEDYRTIVIPQNAKGRRLKLGKLEVYYPTDTSLELKTAFQREFKVIFPAQKEKISIQCDGKIVECKSVTAAASEITFTAMPAKTYIVSKDSEQR